MESLGLDFGTANTSIALSDDISTFALTLDQGSRSIPSAVFFDFEDDLSYIGAQAYERFYLGDNGRFLRSFKSTLGTSTLDHEVQIKRNRYQIRDIISQYIGIILNRAEQHLGRTIDNLVVGRPVHFVDHDPSSDNRAEASLREIVLNLGVRNVEFQLEPIAAALNYGSTISGQELVLVIDIGAGTSDFSVVRFNSMESSTAEVVSNCGVHIGGNDFDKAIALEQIMPLFGYKERFKRRTQLEVPNHYYLQASSWHEIDLLYDRKVINAMSEICPQVFQPELIERFLTLLTTRQVHKVLAEVENAKKEFSEKLGAKIDLEFVEHELRVSLDKIRFHNLIEGLCEKIIGSAYQAVELAGLEKSQINTVYLTGGSMGIKYLHDNVVTGFQGSRIVDGDRATAVARGLALYAKQIGF